MTINDEAAARPYVFRIGDTVTYANQQWEISDIAGTILGIRSVDSGERLTVSTIKVAQENPAEDRIARRTTVLYLAESEATRTSKAAEHQGDILKDVDRRLADVEEVAIGRPQGVLQYREGYGPGSSQWSRAGLKQAELKTLADQLGTRAPELAKKLRVSRSTLFRQANAYLMEGPASLLDGRRTRNHRVTDGLAAEVLEICERVNREHAHSPRVSKKQRAAIVSARLEKLPDRGFAIPGERRLVRVLDELSAGMYLDGDAANRWSAASAPNRVFRSRPGLLPGSQMQVDSTRLDIFLLFPDGSVQRPDAAFLSDVATRSVTAFSLALNICGADVAFMIAQTMTPRPRYDLPSELKNDWELKRRDLPWVQMFDPEVRERLDGMVPLIRPRLIVTDNGRNYTSRAVEAACRQLGITIVRASPYAGTDKGIIERLHGAIKTKFLAKLPGFTGGSVSSSGDEKPKKEGLLTVAEFAWLLDRWIVHCWQNAPTDGLRDPRLGGGPLLSPNAEYAAMFPYVGFIPRPLSRNDFIGLLPTLRRKIHSDGVQMDYRMYDAPELEGLRRRTSGTVLDGLWEVHYLPADYRMVWVYDAETGNYIDCEWKEDRLDKPFAKEVRDLAIRIVEAGGVDPKAIAEATSRSFIESSLQELRRQRRKQAAKDFERGVQDAQRGLTPNISTIRGNEGYVSQEPSPDPEPHDTDGDDEDLEGFEGVNGVAP
jgi:putative transposase